MAFKSVEELLKTSKEEKASIWQAVLNDDINERQTNQDESECKMKLLWEKMKFASKNYNKNERSNSGLVGGDGGKMESAIKSKSTISGDFVSRVIAEALKMGECNACMKCIVAAPTAGSCGVLPSILITFGEFHKIADSEIIKALYVSAGFGQIIAERASISGAEGGCQAEIGTASAMAAAALVFLKGGTNEMMANACAMALKSLLGLVCDPVAGLVEVPCTKRNVIGAMNAISSAEMALARITSKIPCDEVIDTMGNIGRIMPASLKETGEGGLADTPTAKEVVRKLKL